MIAADIQLIFNTFRSSSSQLLPVNPSASSFDKEVIQYIQEWLSEKNEFEFQTSGSTGIPKQIIFSRDQLKASAQLTKEAFQLERGMTALLCLDPAFVAGKMMIVRALEIGLDLISVSPSANPLEHLEMKIDFAAFVPYQIEAILNDATSAEKLSRIKKIIIGGAPIKPGLITKIKNYQTDFFETYGMTETLSHVAIRKLNPLANNFKALPGVNFFVDERSCLTIRANHISGNPIQTNDLVDLFSDTEFTLIGRFDNIINSAGIKIAPEGLENKIASIIEKHANQHSYFIAGIKDQTFGEKLILCIESSSIPAATLKMLNLEFRNVLKKWEVPKDILCIAEFERTSSGKVNRSETLRSAFAH